MAVQVTRTNLFSESRTNVVDLITANVSDPISGSSEYRKWVYSRYPDVKSNDFQGYPFIVLPETSLDNDDPITLNQDFRNESLDYEIEIYADFNDESARVSTLGDEVVYAILKSSNQDTLLSNGLAYPQVTSSPIEPVTIANKKVTGRLISISFSFEVCF